MKKSIKDKFRQFLKEHFLSTPLLNDRDYYKFRFYISNKRKLDLENPVTFFEKLNWLRLNSDYEKFSLFTDKYAVREFVKSRVGERYLIPIEGIVLSPGEIDFNRLPNQFVLKATHGSNMNYICRDKNKIDEQMVRNLCDQWLKIDYSTVAREINYHGITPMILCERLIFDSEGKIPKDYKFFCSHGVVRSIQVDVDRYINHERNFYDPEWNLLPVRLLYPYSKSSVEKPSLLSEMIQLAEDLSAEFTFVRVDLYQVLDRVYFGELTFTPEAGIARISYEHDLLMGSWIDIDTLQKL